MEGNLRVSIVNHLIESWIIKFLFHFFELIYIYIYIFQKFILLFLAVCTHVNNANTRYVIYVKYHIRYVDFCKIKFLSICFALALNQLAAKFKTYKNSQTLLLYLQMLLISVELLSISFSLEIAACSF